MTITARYPGRCERCGGEIRPGDSIEWERGSRPSHSTCPDAGTTTVAREAPSFAPTAEQEAALALFATGESLAIEAGAGTGKTSTLLLLAESTSRRGQYVAFNKAIVREASGKFGDNVACSTAHALAFRAVGRRYAERLRSTRRMKSIDVANRLGIEPIVVQAPDRQRTISASYLGGYVLSFVTRFCQSADEEPTTRHAPYIEGIDEVIDGVRRYDNNRLVAQAMLPVVRRAWADLLSPTGWVPYRHDHYLKAWQLDEPRIAADFILFDEAQDANPVMQAIVAAQTHAQLVWVGDSQQQIYSFTGAVNALANISADSRTFLTQSFRFGPAIAEEANAILDRLDADLRLVGTETIPSRVDVVDDPDAILTRTNAMAVREVLRYQAAGRVAKIEGGGEDVVRFARGVRDLNERGYTDHPDLACFDSWAEVVRYVDEDEQGSELRLLVKLVEDFGVDTILRALDGNKSIREEDADVVVSTAHKAKGREWETVRLAGDFPPDAEGEELRLLYVAVTRAKLVLDVSAIATEEEGREPSSPAASVTEEPAASVPERAALARAATALVASDAASEVEEFLTRVTRPGDNFDVIVNGTPGPFLHASLDVALNLAARARDRGNRAAVYAQHTDGTSDLVIEWDD